MVFSPSHAVCYWRDTGGPGFAYLAALCAVSASGLCLHTRRWHGRGERLVVYIPDLPALPGGRRLLTRVVHSRWTPILRGWVLDCAPAGGWLTDAELRALNVWP